MKNTFDIYGKGEALEIADRFLTWRETWDNMPEDEDMPDSEYEDLQSAFDKSIDCLNNNKIIDKKLKEFINFQYEQATFYEDDEEKDGE